MLPHLIPVATLTCSSIWIGHYTWHFPLASGRLCTFRKVQVCKPRTGGAYSSVKALKFKRWSSQMLQSRRWAAIAQSLNCDVYVPRLRKKFRSIQYPVSVPVSVRPRNIQYFAAVSCKSCYFTRLSRQFWRKMQDNGMYNNGVLLCVRASFGSIIGYWEEHAWTSMSIE